MQGFFCKTEWKNNYLHGLNFKLECTNKIF